MANPDIILPKVLILGASGRIGGILRSLWPVGQTVWQARQPVKAESGQDWRLFDPMADPQALEAAAAGCKAILCLAGVVPGRGERDFDNNITLAKAAIRAGAASGARVFLASSAAVYGNQTGMLDETSPLKPLSPYGHAKAGMETQGAELAQTLNVRLCSLRIGNIAGVDAILGGWKPGFQLDQFADGRTPRRSYIGAVSLAKVLGTLMGAPDLPSDLPDVLNIAAPGMVDMGGLLDAAGLAWTPRPAPDGAIQEVCLSTVRLQRFITLPDADAAQLVAEWQRMTPVSGDER